MGNIKYLLIMLLLIPLATAMSQPTRTEQIERGWVITHSTDYDFTPYIADAKDKKTMIGLIPNSGSCIGLPATKRLYDKNGIAILNDKNKPIDLKCESAKCDGSNCYSISLTDAQAINIDDYIRIGEASTTYEWLNHTLYIYDTDQLEVDPFSIQIYCNDVQITTPDIIWFTIDNPLAEGVKFSANITGFVCNGKLAFRQNKIMEKECSYGAMGYSECETKIIDYSDFESSVYNQIETDDLGIKKNIINVNHGVLDCLSFANILSWSDFINCRDIPYAYDIAYYGNFTDLDPSLTYVYTSSSQLIGNGTNEWRNQTEATHLGVALQRNNSYWVATGLPTVSAYNYTNGWFNSFAYYNLTGTYWNITLSVADSDGSGVADRFPAYDNLVSYWSLDGLNGNASVYADKKGSNHGTPNGTSNATGISSGAISFDGYDDSISMGTKTLGGITTFSAWVYPTGFDDQDIIVGVTSTDNNAYLYMGLRTGGKVLGGYRTASSAYRVTTTNTGTITANNWQHVVAIINTTALTMAYYINGIPSSTIAYLSSGTPSGSVTQPMHIGVNTPGLAGGAANYYHFNGSIDEVLIYNTSLTASEIQQLYKAGLSQHANANVTLQTRVANSYNLSDSGLVSHWSFNDGDITDETGRNDGTFSSSLTFNENFGTVGKGVLSDASGYFVPPVIPLNDGTDNTLTFSAWINPQASSFMEIVGQYWLDEMPYADYYFYIDNYRLGYDSAADFIASTTQLSSSQWSHVAVTCNPATTTVSIYINGELDIEDTSFDCMADTSADNGDIGLSFIGYYDEIRIYNRSLSADEIQNLYEMGSYHIEWNNWQDNGTITDGIPVYSGASSKFIQYKYIFNTNDSSVSPYVLNYQINVTNEVDVPDTTAPLFTTIPPNKTLSYLVDYLNEDFDATDDNPVLYWSINDTVRFNISQEGILINSTLLTEGVYVINVSVNDTANNLNSTLYQVNVVIAPSVTIVYPSDSTTNASQIIEMNITVINNTALYNCWYSLDGGITNTSNPCFANITGITSAEGSNTWCYYANNTMSQTGQDCNTFTIDFPPTWDTIPANASLLFNVDSLSKTFIATDNVGISQYWVNDTTRFNMDSGTGILTNITATPVGIYELLVYANDTFGSTIVTGYNVVVGTEYIWSFNYSDNTGWGNNRRPDVYRFYYETFYCDMSKAGLVCTDY